MAKVFSKFVLKREELTACSVMRSISMNEIVNALKSMKSGNAARYDRITAEMFKAGQGIVASQLYHLFNLC